MPDHFGNELTPGSHNYSTVQAFLVKVAQGRLANLVEQQAALDEINVLWMALQEADPGNPLLLRVP